ncbi:protein FAR-RED IMPAIRED RESPONSE 1-like [Rhododendron vialii]|uniref:protein FAR-RED IMPAIRED RESPONSE 1-like n=1 Tax=Rhododendron vialii TaxID=182163 RepID=UPI00265E340F|nr:protein FAR-RED IMPAIRED RESPONSE 1-like [Rhododendron vialii]
MSPDSVPSAMPPNKECVEEEAVWSGYHEDEQEVWSSPSNKNCGEIDTSGVGKEATENCEDKVEESKEGMTFDTSEEAYSYYSRYAEGKGFAVAKRTSRKGKDGKLKDLTIACSRAGKTRVTTSNPAKPRPQSKINCQAHVTVVLHPNGKWRLNRIALVHNHDQSLGKARYLRSNRIEAGGPGKLPYIQKDCRNHVDKVRRSLLVEGDAQVMHNYFMKMKADNSDFFFVMDLDDEGVNHHGQSVLLGCGLISHEDTESFSWLFQTWKTCMWGCAPKAIITDQCMAMKNAIEDIFPNTRYRWCIWHIMKKIPEKLNGCNAYESISWCMRRAVYASLTIKQFEDAWDVFIKKYELQSNTWLEELYLERKRWVPAYLNDVF